ncbi:hypothetical protein WN48_05855 [Eufriesea mexicana]|uniref:Uncharacterized protein n=1 Tax=Eufriesea mexicana TaxID=516756 RepID=A0A310SKS3_9HYME|nr:hypothetical protein WN48_05855 [Eufriesea mexicana]
MASGAYKYRLEWHYRKNVQDFLCEELGDTRNFQSTHALRSKVRSWLWKLQRSLIDLGSPVTECDQLHFAQLDIQVSNWSIGYARCWLIRGRESNEFVFQEST